MNKLSLFSLFHHEVEETILSSSLNSDRILSLLNRSPELTISQLANVIYQAVENEIAGIANLNDGDISLTLTGGMDSRVILACLLKAGIKPNCFTFGDLNAKDVHFANKLAAAFSLPFQNVVSRKPDKDWYYYWVKEVIKADQGNSHLHRAHRLAAITEHCDDYAPKVLFTGHMGGEGIRGLSYNNYFASRFFEEVNEGRKDIKESAVSVLHEYFVRPEVIEWDSLLEKVRSLPYMQSDKKMNTFHFLYDLVAPIHHSQDQRLFKTKVPSVFPVYLQQEYLETLFSSNHHFLNKPSGLFGKLKNPQIHSELLNEIYPPLLEHPLSNGYKPKEYLKGLWYVLPATTIRKLKSRNEFTPTFSYGQWYIDFVKEHSANIADEIWDFYDRNRYMKALENNDHKNDEGYWHKFSNPIYFDLVRKYEKGELE